MPTAPNTPPEVAEVLSDPGVFYPTQKPAGSALIGGPASDWWDLHHPDTDVLLARFVATLEDGFEVYAFAGAGVCSWSARYTASTPIPVLEAAIDALFADAATKVD